MLIVFDGIDGAGKTFHLELIKNWLTQINHEFVAYQEPGGTEFGKKIRQLFYESAGNVAKELFLISAARADLCQEIALQTKTVLCDRFFDSTYVYQGLKLPYQIIDYCVKLSTHTNNQFIVPNHVFLFLHPYKNKTENAMDIMATQHRAQLINGFKRRMLACPERYTVVEHDTVQKQQEFIKEKISVLLKLKNNVI